MQKRTPVPQQGIVREVADSFRKATGLPLQFHQPGEYHVPDNDSIPPFCRLMAPSDRFCERCLRAHLALQDPEGIEARTAECFAGLTSSAVPVCSGSALLGFLHTGHASVERPPQCADPGRQCHFPGRGLRLACAGTCLKTPEITRNRYEGAVELLGLLAGRVAAAPQSLVPGGAYPAIDRAVEILRSDVTRDWSLTSIARQVGMHPGYFSERFHKHAGITFGNFLAGLRVERASHLLEFTSLSISDVAFASGFRSLSQFNRTFKKFAGKAPGELFRKGDKPGLRKPATHPSAMY